MITNMLKKYKFTHGLGKRFKKHHLLSRLAKVERLLSFDPEDGYLVFSDPRGGSTWLAEMLRTIPNTAVLWEPLNICEDSLFNRLSFGGRQHIPENQAWSEAKKAFTLLFAGQALTETNTFFEKRDLSAYVRADNLITKFVNGNALLPWLCSQFTFKYKPIFLVRHPFAVVASQLKHGAWDHVDRSFKIPDMRFNDHYRLHSNYLKTLTTLEEINLAHWCLSNLPTLRNARNNIDWIVVNYENLVINPKIELGRIFSAWDVSIPSGLLDNISTPSITVKKGSPIIGMEQVNYWAHSFNNSQFSKMQKVMNYFGVEFYSKGYPMPEIDFS